MKVIIAGSRDITDIKYIKEAIAGAGFDITEIVSGTARGVDKLGEQYAKINNYPVKKFPAKWKAYGKIAGHVRNNEMAKYADALIAIWDGKSKGTKNMINTAFKKNLKVYILGVN